MIALQLVTASGWACSCAGPGWWDFVGPAEGAVGVPRNARFRIGIRGGIPSGGSYDVFEDGVFRDDVVVTPRIFGTSGVSEVSVETPYAPGATVEIRQSGTDFVLTTFQVGDDVDEEPPSWDGDYDVSSSNEVFGTCEWLAQHTFTWRGLADDLWETDSVMAVLEPLDGRFAFARDWGDSASVVYGLCTKDDPTLLLDFHRRYSVTFEDLSGNRTEPVVVGTGGCACGVVASPSGGWMALAALAAVARRRRR